MPEHQQWRRLGKRKEGGGSKQDEKLKFDTKNGAFLSFTPPFLKATNVLFFAGSGAVFFPDFTLKL
jgi:hypothetical protein